MWNKIKYTLPFFLLLSGCADIQTTMNNIVVKSVQNKEAEEIASAMSELSDTDVTVLYKQYIGVCEFMKNTNYIKSTQKLDEVFGTFPGIYNFSTDNKKWLDFIEKWFDSRNYSTNKLVVESVSDEKKEISKKQVIADFQILAEGAKLRLDQINGRK